MIALIERAEGRICARSGVAEMAGDRLHRILAALSGGGDAWSSARLCAECPGIVGVNGAGVMLMSSDIPRGSLNSTDDVSELIEELSTRWAMVRARMPASRRRSPGAVGRGQAAARMDAAARGSIW
jgi:hypothetical protein